MTDDTIAAIATPVGQAGIGVIRISGDDALHVAGRVFRSAAGKRAAEFPSHTVHLGAAIDPQTAEHIDEVLLTVFRAPHSYTGENTAELSCHGGSATLRRILNAVLSAGARHAEPGEFTKRAFLNGKMDLAQAEAVNDLIRAQTDEAHRLALRQLEGALSSKVKAISSAVIQLLAGIEASVDFPDDVDEPNKGQLQRDIHGLSLQLTDLLATADRGVIYREGITVAIAGRPNVGKSSLLNALLRQSRAIVTATPGTTRDTIEESFNINGIPMVAIDTAGLREAQDEAEQLGVKRAEETVERAQIVVLVLDAVEGVTDEDLRLFEKLGEKPRLVALNKSDLLSHEAAERAGEEAARRLDYSAIAVVSALTGDGIVAMEERMAEMVLGGAVAHSESVLVSNVRHKRALEAAVESLNKAAKTVDEGRPIDLLSVDLMAARNSLGEITGETATEDLIDRIFSEFCIGK